MYLHIFSFKWTFLVKMKPYSLNPNLVINLCSAVVLHYNIILAANSLHIMILLDFFLVHLPVHIYAFNPEWYFTIVTCKCLWSNPSSICFSFNYNIPSLSTTVSTPFLFFILFLCLYQPYLNIVLNKSFRIFYFFFH